MGNFPYPSSYITNGAGELPAYPVRAACEIMAPELNDGPQLMTGEASAVYCFSEVHTCPASCTAHFSKCLSDFVSTGAHTNTAIHYDSVRLCRCVLLLVFYSLYAALAQAAGVLYNFSGTLECLSPGTGRA